MKNSPLPPRKTANDIALKALNKKPIIVSPWTVFWIIFFAGIGFGYLLHQVGWLP